MHSNRTIFLLVFFLSCSVVCFEILATRISSVIFVSSYAYIIVSLAIFGLSCGAIVSYFKLQRYFLNARGFSKIILWYSCSLLTFILCIVYFQITTSILFFIALLPPFVLAGIFFAQLYRVYAQKGFQFYAADLAGAASGALLPLVMLPTFGAVASVLLIAGVFIVVYVSMFKIRTKKSIERLATIVLLISLVGILCYRGRTLLPEIPIGLFPEKDFYHVYPMKHARASIIDSRWSIFGRSDFVSFSHQDVVRYLFIDGSAGSPMYRFSGNTQRPERLLLELLLHETIGFPFMVLQEEQKDSMLVIGPGGGKEILLGLFSGVRSIIGVEVNPDFVNFVRKYRDFNGGIYDNFSNVSIIIDEGRHFVKQTNGNYDLILLALPSTEQLQNVDALAANENYLLTIEALHDYFKVLTPEGQLIFTLHNSTELLRMIVTVCTVFQQSGAKLREALEHIAVIESEYYPPTLLVKKTPFTEREVNNWLSVMRVLPEGYPFVTFHPFLGEHYPQNKSYPENFYRSEITSFVHTLLTENVQINDVVNQYPADISVCTDDRPFFYNLTRGVPKEFLYYLVAIGSANLFILALFLQKLYRAGGANILRGIFFPSVLFLTIGIGFMVIEVSLFQILVLYLGSATIALSILLCALLLGMGCGSILGVRIAPNNQYHRVAIASLLVVTYGVLLFLLAPKILMYLLGSPKVVRIFVTAGFLIPLGFLLGTFFPAGLMIIKDKHLECYTPWMYGINGAMSVLGSVLAMVCSMMFGFTVSFFLGITFYLIVFLVTIHTVRSCVK